MRKNSFYLWAMMVVAVLCIGFTSCGDDDELTESKDKVIVTSAVLTENGYFDGILYYRKTSNSPNEVTVSKAEEIAEAIDVPTIVNIDGESYKCTSISTNAFTGCPNLTKVSIPNSVELVCSLAFANCNLVEVTINTNATGHCVIDLRAFEYCKSLTEVTFGEGVIEIGNEAFSNCTSLAEVTINNGKIGSSAFSDCTNLTKVTIGDDVTEIGYQAFYGCTSLTDVTISSGKIDSRAFGNCTSLTEVTFGDGVTEIGSYAFDRCMLAEVTIPSSVKSIGEGAFSDSYDTNRIHCKSAIPPSAASLYPKARSRYDRVGLYVPIGALDAYRADEEWGQFKSIIEE